MRRLEDDKEELKPVFYEQHHKKKCFTVKSQGREMLIFIFLQVEY